MSFTNSRPSLPSCITRSNLKYDISKFTTTTSLFLVNFFMFNRFRKSFFISNLRSTLVDLNFKLTLQTIDDNLQGAIHPYHEEWSDQFPDQYVHEV